MFKKKTMAKPEARTAELSVTESGAETLVYDRENFVIHRLNKDTAQVWQLADGTRDVATLAAEAKLPVSTVESALVTLVSNGLVKTESVDTSIFNRRRFIGGAAGAAAAAAFIGKVAASGTEPCDACSASEQVPAGPGRWGTKTISAGCRKGNDCCGAFVTILDGEEVDDGTDCIYSPLPED